MQRLAEPISCASSGCLAAAAPRARVLGRHAVRPRLSTAPTRRTARALRPSALLSALKEPEGAELDAVHSSFTEMSRQYFRTVYDFEKWQEHRSSSRYARHVVSILWSRSIRNQAGVLTYGIAVATFVAIYETGRQAGLLPHVVPDLAYKGGEFFTYTSFVLGLLLVFRTNASYERWDDARKMWGLVLNRSRDVVRQGLVWIPRSQPDLRDALCRWVPAFSKTLMCHLRRDGDPSKELQGILLPHEIAAVMQAAHKPNYVMQVIHQILATAQLPTPGALQMDKNITAFEDCLGGCERILRTPIPLLYTRHTSRFFIIWLTLLPFSLWGTWSWATVPMCGVIGFLLLGIKEMGVSIEEPFSILALEAISDTALKNVRELEAQDKEDGAHDDSAAHLVAIAAAGGAGKLENNIVEARREPLAVSNRRLARAMEMDGGGSQ